jgi:AraC-like DNA-binding protein
LFGEIKLEIISQSLFPVFIFVILTLPLLMYLYITSLLQPIIWKNYFKHLLPAIISSLITLVSLIIVFVNVGSPGILNIFFNVLYYNILFSLIVVFTIQNGYYIFLSIKDYQKQKKTISELASFELQVNLKWIFLYIISYTTLIILIYASHLFNSLISSLLFSGSFVLFLYFLWHLRIKQIDLYVQTFKIETQQLEEEKVDTPNEIKNENLIKNEELSAELEINIVKLIEDKELYLNPNLTIFDVAKELNVNYKYISHIINSKLNKSFVLLINEYRVKRSIEIINTIEGSIYTLESISEMSGFNSKSSFNTFFKKITGKTPSEFRKTKRVS